MKKRVKLGFTGEYTFDLLHEDGEHEIFKAYNTFCDNLFAKQNVRAIELGGGQGTPSPADQVLFSPLWEAYLAKTPVIEDTLYTDPLHVYETVSAVFPADPDYVGEITEAGLKGSGEGRWLKLVTHTMLTDAEGQPLTIVKTENDQLTVTVRVDMCMQDDPLLKLMPAAWHVNKAACTIPSYYMARLLNKPLYTWFCGSSDYMSEGSSPTITFYPCCYIVQHSEGDYYMNKEAKPFLISGQFDADTHTMLYEGDIRYLPAGFNTHYYRFLQLGIVSRTNRWGDDDQYIALSQQGIDLLQHKEIFGEQPFNDVEIGIGDGSTTNFACPLNYFKKDSEVLKKNGVALTRGVDYTIDNLSNKDCMTELSFLPYPEMDDITLTGGKISTSEDYSLFGPGWQFVGVDDQWPVGLSTSYPPIVFDWVTPRLCDTLDINCKSYRSPSTVSVAYRNAESEEWTEVCNVTEKGTDPLHIHETWPGITARYWQIKLVSGGDLYYLQRPSWSTGQHIFLGHSDPLGIKFVEAPAQGDVLTMSCVSDIPYKSSNWAFNLNPTLSITVS